MSETPQSPVDPEAPRRRRARKTEPEPPPEPPVEETASEEEVAEEEQAPEEPPILPEGNRVRLLRGGAAILAGSALAFCLMAVQAQYRWGVPLGALGIFLATFGLLDLLGSFDDPDDRVAGSVTLRELGPPLGLAVSGLVAVLVFVCMAVDGRFGSAHPVLAAGILIPAAFLTLVVGVYRTGAKLGAWSEPERPLLKRHGFWLVTAMTALYLPSLGSHSLSDPWETHYGEVSREILARNDWISTWWAQDGWFWSKPVLDFWVQALSMATFGVRHGSDQVLSAVREGRIPWPEWAMRLPVFLLSLAAVYLLYKAVAKVFGRRAGLLGGVVLLTMPQWFILTHQTMTDMPFVAPMASAMALMLLGAHTDPEAQARVYEVDLGFTKLRLSGYHLVLGTVIACALPQILYLFSRNLSLDIRGFHSHPDVFSWGSPGNCGMPGNEQCREAVPVLKGLHPALQALIWVQSLALVLYLNWGERRTQRLYFLAAWLFAALSTMAKGPAGVMLPVLCALAYIAVSGRWRDLLRLEITSGFLILLAVALPWYVAMYGRHGQPFTDRLLFHDMFKRAFTHVHDTNEGDDVSFRFYVWQLGYATFPWTGLVPAGLLYWLRRREEDSRKSDASVFLAMWFVFAFALFSLMLTKFHHYILPAVPPAAMLTGILLDALLRRSAPSQGAEAERERTPLDILLYVAGLGAGLTSLLYGLARVIGPKGEGFTQSLGFGWALVALGVVALGATFGYLGHAGARGGAVDVPEGASLEAAGDPQLEGYRRRFEAAQLGAVGVAGAVVAFMVGRDLSATLDGMPNQVRLFHLVTYNYRRPWPNSLDFTPTLWAFTLTAAALSLGLVWTRYRRHVVGAIVALGVAFGAWGLDVYMMKIGPHWGQRETILAYYEASREAPGPVVAYQMNWKGENFYTGNHVPAFVSSGKRFQDYVLEEKKKGTRTFYFMTEHGRVGTLQNELGTVKSFDKLTTPELDNKFLLVRAVFD